MSIVQKQDEEGEGESAPLWARNMTEKMDIIIRWIDKNDKQPRPSGNISDLSFSSVASAGTVGKNIPSFSGDYESPQSSSSINGGGKLELWKETLLNTNSRWKKAKLTDISEFLQNSAHFIQLATKSIPEVIRIREQLLNGRPRTEQDADQLTATLSGLLIGAASSKIKKHWRMFLRTLCAPHFNTQDPVNTGATIQDYDDRVEAIAEKVIEYMFPTLTFLYPSIRCTQKTMWVCPVQKSDVVDIIRAIHANKTDNEIRYVRQLVKNEHPEGDVKVVRRDKITKLFDCIKIVDLSSPENNTSHADESSSEDEGDRPELEPAKRNQPTHDGRIAKAAVKRSLAPLDDDEDEDDEEEAEVQRQVDLVAMAKLSAVRSTVGGKQPKKNRVAYVDGTYALVPPTSSSSSSFRSSGSDSRQIPLEMSAGDSDDFVNEEGDKEEVLEYEEDDEEDDEEEDVVRTQAPMAVLTDAQRAEEQEQLSIFQSATRTKKGGGRGRGKSASQKPAERETLGRNSKKKANEQIIAKQQTKKQKAEAVRRPDAVTSPVVVVTGSKRAVHGAR